MDSAGVLDERHDQVDDLVRARHLPSPQLIGTPEHRSIDLNTLAELGVEIVGRLGSIQDGVAQFSGGLANNCRLADLKMNRLLDRLDDWARRDSDVVEPPQRFEPTTDSLRPRPRDRPAPPRHRHDHLVDRLPTRLFLARHPSAGPQGPNPPPRRNRR